MAVTTKNSELARADSGHVDLVSEGNQQFGNSSVSGRVKVKTIEEYRAVTDEGPIRKGTSLHCFKKHVPTSFGEVCYSVSQPVVSSRPVVFPEELAIPRVGVRLTRINKARDYSASMIDGCKLGCPNSPICPRGNIQHHCLFPPLKETLPGSFVTRGFVQLKPQIMGKYFAMNLSYSQHWGVTFFIRETSDSISIYPWMDTDKVKLHAQLIMCYRLTFYGRESHQVRIRGNVGGQTVTIPKGNIRVTPSSGHFIARYRLKMKIYS